MTRVAEIHRRALAHVVRQRVRVAREAERLLAELQHANRRAQLGIVLADLRDAGFGPEPGKEAS